MNHPNLDRLGTTGYDDFGFPGEIDFVMDFKGYLYLACAAGTAVGAMNIARRGIAGPGTLLVFIVPLFGLLALFAIDVWNFLQFQRNRGGRKRQSLARDLVTLWDRTPRQAKTTIAICVSAVGGVVGLACTFGLLADLFAPPDPQPDRPAPAGPLGLQPRGLNNVPPAATVVPGLLAYWPFDEGAGAEAGDQSGNRLDGQLRGANRVPGVRGSALHFAMHGQHFDYGSSPLLNFPANGSFTVSLWIATRDDRATILAHRNGGEPGAVVWIGLEAGRLKALIRQDLGEAGQPAVVETVGANDGVWHHVAVVRNGGAVELFVDGEWRSKSVSPFAAGAITTDLRAAGQEKYWTKFHFLQFGNPHWVGQLDELAIFNRDLGPAEIAKLAGR